MNFNFEKLGARQPAGAEIDTDPKPAPLKHWRDLKSFPPNSILHTRDLAQPDPNLFTLFVAALLVTVTGVGLGVAVFFLFFVGS